MNSLPLLLLTAPIALLLLTAAVPSRLANRQVNLMRRLVTIVAAIQMLASMAALVWGLISGAWHVVALRVSESVPVSISLYYDGVAGLMLMLVSFVAVVVCRYSVRYLDGEATQGRYFRWIALTIGAVSLMVVAGNLLLFFVAWVMTSFGLHQLLLHYPHRPAARRAAWTKFAISRLGDVLLIAALVLTYKTFGTWELSTLFDSLRDAPSTGSQATTALIAWLLMLGAVTKSAQFPFHTWLPDTMETPTPVSALMHAGIVNAGGYLVIRMSPLIAQSTAALTALAVIGGVTACFAGVVMMTQASVKRTLAYSTIAQMGFMMLQCGLGAFSAAMLHILAHSLYKAHAFLNSGSVVSQALATGGAKLRTPGPQISFLCLLGALAAAVAAVVSTLFVLGIDYTAQPGGYALALVLCLALTSWGWRVFGIGTRRAAIVGLIGIASLSLAYGASYLAVDQIVGPSIATISASQPTWVLSGIVAVAFCVLFGLHAISLKRQRPKWLEAVRVHAANGFYIDVIYRQVLGSLAE